MRYFDYAKAAREARISPDKLEALSRAVREEFPHDEMMYELHLLRACTAIREGRISLEEALRPKQTA